MTTRYMPIETFSAVVTDAQSTAKAVVFTLPYMPTGYVAQIYAPTTGAINNTGLTVLVAQDSTTKVITATIAATVIAKDSVVTLICF